MACGQPSKNKNMKYQPVHSDKPLSTVVQNLPVVDLCQYNNMLYKTYNGKLILTARQWKSKQKEKKLENVLI